MNEENKREEDKIIDAAYTEAHPLKEIEEDSDQGVVPCQGGLSACEQTKAYYHETIKDCEKKKKRTAKNKGGMGKFVAGLTIVSVAGGFSLGAGYGLIEGHYTTRYDHTNELAVQPVQETYTQPLNYTPATFASNPVPDIASAVGPSVVSINNNSTVLTWMGEFSQESLGSGVIFQQDEQKVYMISNAHVVEDASTLTVTFLGNTKVPAHIVGADTSTDIAVIATYKSDIPEEMLSQIKEAPLGDSDTLRVGEQVVAIGTPIDEAYYNTVSVGYVSALGREINLTDQELTLIQTDAAINPGNSGGALVGPTGEVIGINTMKIASQEQPIEGMGFAIPINDVKPIVEELIAYGKIIRPSLGISGQDMTEEFGNRWEIPVGIRVHQVVPGSSADIAGILPGDVIIEFDGLRVSTMEEIKELLNGKNVGDEITVRVVRGSDKLTLDVKLQEMPSQTLIG